MFRRFKRPGRGVTLIEAVLFISVALGVIIGGLVFYQQASTGLMTQRFLSLVSALSTEVNALHQNTSIDNVEVSEILIKSGAVPTNAINDSGDGLVAPWDGQILIVVLKGANPGSEQFGDNIHLIHVFDVPPEVCARLAFFDVDGSGAFGFPMTGLAIDSSNSGVDLATGTLLSPGTTDLFSVRGGPLSRADGGASCARSNGAPVWMYFALAYR